ncbi:putative epoxide hydrolase [Sugiyamaella lignohabitans]|uniref:Putative epoxide hydrolase n=1 Tax=Sugiyamaella lignohabitans TaxID=796027 RepID=A0A161HG16_9ASCO|nr:putative epoxide hydrolase [Sugiyamaella lignohabitans]ANB14600.1 putative epoxide hydrolase [Sugiyamaella lignohabitans]
MSRFEVKLHANNLTFSAYSSYTEHQLAQVTPDRIILLLHGFPDTRQSFDEIWPILEKKYPAPSTLLLAPSLRGYEPETVLPSRLSYTPTDIASDVIGWIKEIIGDKKIPVHLIGHDWGALATFRTASLQPDLITSISTLAIPYMVNLSPLELLWHVPEQIYLSSYMVRMQTSYFYGSRLYEDAVTTVVGAQGKERKVLPYIEYLWKYWSPGWKFTQDELADFCEAVQKPGVVDATTGYYRSLAAKRDRYWRVDFNKVPGLLIGGRDDGCMSYRLYDLQREKLAPYGENVKIALVDKVGHFMHRENPVTIAELCIDWIDSHE